MSTSETASDQENLEPEHRERIDAYLQHGGEVNVRGLLDYLARELAGRDVVVPPVVERPQEGYFHLGETLFPTLEEYEVYLSAQRPRLMDADAPRVVLFGPFLDPLSPLERGPLDELLNALERRGVRVYPMFGREPFPQIERIWPDLAIVFPHGRLQRGDTWETEDQIARRYLDNMSGVYRGDDAWGTVAPGVVSDAIGRCRDRRSAEIVVQPRSSNTWGPLSLDHVYEFMGGISLAIRNTTGNDPTGYFSDLRDPARPRAATAAAAIREETRTQVWNPRFIAGMQREGPSAAAALTENVRNLYGWSVMQPAAVSQAEWDETFEVYIDDKHGLDLQAYFEDTNPAALQDMTAIMLETIRKGMWTPSDEVVQRLAELHAELVARHGAGCSYETCGNAKLHEFLAAALGAPGSEAAPEIAESYHASLAAALKSFQPLPEVEGMELEEKRTIVETLLSESSPLATALLASLIVAATALLVLVALIRPTPLAA